MQQSSLHQFGTGGLYRVLIREYFKVGNPHVLQLLQHGRFNLKLLMRDIYLPSPTLTKSSELQEFTKTLPQIYLA